MRAKFGETETLCTFAALKSSKTQAGVAQLVEHDLAKVGVASSSLVSRSKKEILVRDDRDFFFIFL
jgi:hypothetical protein